MNTGWVTSPFLFLHMKIKLLENVLIGTERLNAGEVVDVPQAIAKSLTADGLAKSLSTRKKDEPVQEDGQP